MKRFIKKILAAVDGSEKSAKALEQAVVVAKVAEAQLTILEVVEPFGPLPGYYGAAPPGEERVKWIADQRLEKIHTVLDQIDMKWERMVEEGYPADVICDVAEKGNFDLIFIGSRGMNPIARFLVGSISDRVVHHAPCSVVVVR